MENKNTHTTKYNMPAKSKDYVGEFIVFYPEEENPEILFHSPNPNDAYETAEKINKEKGRLPTVLHIRDEDTNVSLLLNLLHSESKL